MTDYTSEISLKWLIGLLQEILFFYVLIHKMSQYYREIRKLDLSRESKINTKYCNCKSFTCQPSYGQLNPNRLQSSTNLSPICHNRLYDSLL